MSTTTIIKHADILERHNIPVHGLEFPNDLLKVLTGPQAQGDVGIIPNGFLMPDGETYRFDAPGSDQFKPLPKTGAIVVAGETSGGNTHILHSLDGECSWAVNPARSTDLVQGWLKVPAGCSATLIHTEEHGVKGIGEGVYEVRRSREFAGEWRRIAD